MSDFNGSGVLEDRTATITSADGRSLTVDRDLDGDGVTDQSETRVTAADGSITDTRTDLAADGATIDQTVTSFSADGLSKNTQVDLDGDGSFDRTTSDVTVDQADGSQTETVTTTSADWTVLSRVTSDLSADRQTKTITPVATGDGAATRTETIKTGTGGTTTGRRSTEKTARVRASPQIGHALPRRSGVRAARRQLCHRRLQARTSGIAYKRTERRQLPLGKGKSRSRCGRVGGEESLRVIIANGW